MPTSQRCPAQPFRQVSLLSLASSTMSRNEPNFHAFDGQNASFDMMGTWGNDVSAGSLDSGSKTESPRQEKVGGQARAEVLSIIESNVGS